MLPAICEFPFALQISDGFLAITNNAERVVDVRLLERSLEESDIVLIVLGEQDEFRTGFRYTGHALIWLKIVALNAVGTEITNWGKHPTTGRAAPHTSKHRRATSAGSNSLMN